MQKVGLMYLHIWILQNHLKQRSEYRKNYFYANDSPNWLNNRIRGLELKILLELMIKSEHVFLFSNEFSREIHDELKRVKRTLWQSLELNQIGMTDLSDVLYYHVLMENADD